MRIGVLILTTQNQDLDEALKLARRKFQATPHCAGHTPAEIHLHPDRGIEQGTKIDGLMVVINDQVPANCLRLTTIYLDDESDNELNRERAKAAKQIAGLAGQRGQAAA